MANLTLNFADASFDGSDDYVMTRPMALFTKWDRGNASGLLSRRAPVVTFRHRNGRNGNIRRFTLAHNQDFYFEFEESGRKNRRV